MNMLLSNMNINMPFIKGHMGALSYYILQIRYSGGTDILEPKALKEFIGSWGCFDIPSGILFFMRGEKVKYKYNNKKNVWWLQ